MLSKFWTMLGSWKNHLSKKERVSFDLMYHKTAFYYDAAALSGFWKQRHFPVHPTPMPYRPARSFFSELAAPFRASLFLVVVPSDAVFGGFLPPSCGFRISS